MKRPRSLAHAALLAAPIVTGCIPFVGTRPPDRTWRADEPAAVQANSPPSCSEATLRDPRSPAWSPEGRALLEHRVSTGEPVVVSALGCRVEVLVACKAKGTYQRRADRLTMPESVRLDDLTGKCPAATHVVRTVWTEDAEAQPLEARRVLFAPIALGEDKIAGRWVGKMRQPNGPYGSYDVTMDLAVDGDRVAGVAEIDTADGLFYGDFEIQGRVDGSTLLLGDAALLDDNSDGFFVAWCSKQSYLVVDGDGRRMTGLWRASGCSPGSFELVRAKTD